MAHEPIEQAAKESPAFYTLKEAAARLRVARSTLWRAAKAGEIKAVRIGGVWRIPARVLAALETGEAA